MQLDLFAPPRQPPTRVLYSGTSIESRRASFEAAVANVTSGQRASQCVRLLRMYRSGGPMGWTDAEISRQLGIASYVVPARRKNLGELGYRIVATGERRHKCCCWRLA